MIIKDIIKFKLKKKIINWNNTSRNLGLAIINEATIKYVLAEQKKYVCSKWQRKHPPKSTSFSKYWSFKPKICQ